MTLKKFNKLYDHYKTYYDLQMRHITYKQLEDAIAKDEEWL